MTPPRGDGPDVDLDQATRLASAVLDAVEVAIVGKRHVLELVLAGLLTRGHILLEDLPGVAKTVMARSFAIATGGSFQRIQFTPDLLPSDVTGSPVLTPSGQVEFRPGPLFANFVLGDEINRAPPKTQSALLEAMQEGQVTSDGVTHPLPRPFAVVATQNPIEFEGTYPLPEAQLDRFRLRLSIGYPDEDGERELVARRLERGAEDPDVPTVTDPGGLVALQDATERVHLDPSLADYAVALARATRDQPGVEVGASPRGSLALVLTARAHALIQGRTFVVPDDVHAVAPAALAHRIVLRPTQWVRGVRPESIVERVLTEVPTPPPVPPPVAASR